MFHFERGGAGERFFGLGLVVVDPLLVRLNRRVDVVVGEMSRNGLVLSRDSRNLADSAVSRSVKYSPLRLALSTGLVHGA